MLKKVVWMEGGVTHAIVAEQKPDEDGLLVFRIANGPSTGIIVRLSRTAIVKIEDHRFQSRRWVP